MNPERWQRIKEIVYEAVELDARQRQAYLERACNGDTTLRREVETLVAASDEAGTFLDQIVPPHGAADDDLAGSMIGPYRLTVEIGRGGMGIVYRAVREDEYRQFVAIKIVKHGLNAGDMLVRFRHERQILALLNHPNIARMLDGGTTQDGRPYFVMELVAGRPIDAYCDENQLGIKERLRLFVKVCAAVAHAHRHLVIHRDLKPDNILITSDGEPKLLDFGIAKVFTPDQQEGGSTLTSAWVRLLTPDYASPEQVLGERITTATDIYSLGAVLYELLTGAKVHRLANASITELERVICRTDALKPSESPGAKRELRGDLDTILFKALQKQPERRYLHVEQFAEDIGRYLEGQPVLARPDTFRYRAGKFCRRNKAVTAAAAVVLITLIAGVIGISWQARIARRERAIAERRFNDVRKLAGSMIFEVDGEISLVAGATKARELLLARSLEYLDRLSKDAGNNPDLARELAAGYEKVAGVRGLGGVANLGLPEVAVENIRKALTLREQVLASNPSSLGFRVELADTARQLAGITRDPAEATRLIQRSREILEEAVRQRPTDQRLRIYLANVIFQGAGLMQTTQPQQAIAQFQQALALYQDPNDISLTHKRIGALLVIGGDIDRSLEEYRAAVALDEETVRRQPDNARAKMNLSFGYSDWGYVLYQSKRPKEAIEKYLLAEGIREQQAAADPRDYRARRAMVSISWRLLQAQAAAGDKPAARQTLRNAVGLGEALVQDFPRHPDAVNELMNVYMTAGEASRDLEGCSQAILWYEKLRKYAVAQKMPVAQADQHLAECRSTH
jgi:eukaryotic-like serine/threonine-protein kinase